MCEKFLKLAKQLGRLNKRLLKSQVGDKALCKISSSGYPRFKVRETKSRNIEPYEVINMLTQ